MIHDGFRSLKGEVSMKRNIGILWTMVDILKNVCQAAACN